MNVCFFSDISVLGGGELWVLNAARALVRAGHGAAIVCPYGSALFASAIAHQIDVHGHMLGSAPPFHEPLFHFLRTREIDALYCTVIGRFCESEVLGAAVRRLNRERQGREAVLLLKTGLPPVPQLNARYYGVGPNSEAARLHVVSEDNRQQFIGWLPDTEGFVRVMREGVDLSRFHRNGTTMQDARATWDLPASARIVTCASRLLPQKGQDNLLLAAQEIVRRHADVCFVFAGTGKDEERLTQLSEHLGLSSHVRFLGHVQDIPRLLTATDIFCHPSLADGMPNAVVEAMAMGLPVLASAVGGVPEILHDDDNGLLIPPHDIRQLVQRLATLVEHEELRARLGARASTTIRAEMDFTPRFSAWQAAVAGEVAERRSGQTTARVAPVPTSYPVLFLMNHLRTGGEETEVAILAKHLDRRRFPLSVATGAAVPEPSPAGDWLRQLGVVVDESCHALETVEERVSYLAGLIAESGVRLVVACQDTQLAYSVFERLGTTTCRLVEHAGIASEVRRIPKTFSAALVGVSAGIARAAVREFADPHQVRVIPSMVDTADYRLEHRAALRDAYGFADDVVVVFAGRLDAKKGIDTLIDAAGALLPDLPQLRFLVVGPADAFQHDYARAIYARAQRELPADRFIFAGARGDLPQILVAADMLVLPSRNEGMSHVINEAGAARLPVVAFADGAAAEQLASGADGMLVAAGDVRAFTEAVRTLATNAPLRSRLGSRLRDRVLASYAADRVVPLWHSLFNELARDLPPSAAAPAVRGVTRDRLLPFPLEIQVETNTACNATCIMCPYPEVAREMRNGELDVRGGRMDLALYRKILDECAGERGLRRIEPFLNNEPFTDTRMVEWIAMAKQTVPHAAVTVTTNGSLVTPRIADKLIKTGLDGIWFSFNGATRETYEKIMGLSYDQVKRNIDYLLDVKPPSLRIFTNMIDTRPMSGEIAENIKYWQQRGVQSGSSVFVNRAGNVGNFDVLNYRVLSPKPARICELLYYKMYIGYNGDVLLCCMDWRRRVVLGNARTQTLREIWAGEPYQRFRRLHEENRADELELCKSCSYIHA